MKLAPPAPPFALALVIGSSSLGTGASAVAVADAPPSPGPFDDIDELRSALSSPSILTEGSVEAYVDECYGTFFSDPTNDGPYTQLSLVEGSNYQLMDQPAGLCMNTLPCMFERCFYHESWFEAVASDPEAALPENAGDVLSSLAADGLFALALPDYVVHPTSVADVVASVRFAAERGVPIFVKTTGHHYAGASSGQSGSLLINTRGLPVYSIDESDEGGARSLVQVCDPADAEPSYLADACRLALARGKTAVIRVGGGEVWDTVLRSVLAYNDALPEDEARLHVLSGGAGTVSAAGGWLASGGNSAARGTRLLGYGVDQVLKMEMVTPDGRHVRFGPSEWEDDPDFLYPRTVAVSGYCNENPVENEAEWVWAECSDDEVGFSFADLWMATRGGGGGTWGIVTSVVYQLHPQPEGGNVPLKFLAFPQGESRHTFSDAWLEAFDDDEMMRVLDEAVEDFKIDFYFSPSALGVSEEDSHACGCDWTSSPHFQRDVMAALVTPASEGLCLGKKAAEAWSGAWNVYVTRGRGVERLLGGGFTSSQIDDLSGWAFSDDWRQRFQDYLGTYKDELGFTEDQINGLLNAIEEGMAFDDYTRENIATVDDIGIPPGHVRDEPRPYIAQSPATSMNIPVDVLLENRDLLVPHLAESNARGEPHYVLGGWVSKSHDQMTAVPQNKREAGIYVHWYGEALERGLNILFGNATKNGGIFPGYVGHNHHVQFGPLKEDWTKPCPDSYSVEEKEDLCLSEQEAVWGTDLLAKLEKIKVDVDPNYLMTCVTGVGFGKKPQNLSAEDEDSLPGEVQRAAEDGAQGTVALSLATARTAGSQLPWLVGLLAFLLF